MRLSYLVRSRRGYCCIYLLVSGMVFVSICDRIMQSFKASKISALPFSETGLVTPEPAPKKKRLQPADLNSQSMDKKFVNEMIDDGDIAKLHLQRQSNYAAQSAHDLPESMRQPFIHREPPIGREQGRARTRSGHKITVFTQASDQALLNDFVYTSGQFDVTFTLQNISSLSVFNQQSCSASAVRQGFLAEEYSVEQKVRCCADALLCIHPLMQCNAYVTYDKPLLLWIHDLKGQECLSKAGRRKWFNNLLTIMSNPANFVAVTSFYDLEYVRFYTGKEAKLMPPFCEYIKETYLPSHNTVLIYYGGDPSNPIWQVVSRDLKRALALRGSDLSLVLSKDVIEPLRPHTLIQYQSIIYIPHAFSSLRFTEFYRMNIPLYVPALELLVLWQNTHNILRTNSRNAGRKAVERQDNSLPGYSALPDPHGTQDPKALPAWLILTDMYIYAHLLYYESVAGLGEALSDAKGYGKRLRTSHQMSVVNEMVNRDSREVLKSALAQISNQKNSV